MKKRTLGLVAAMSIIALGLGFWALASTDLKKNQDFFQREKFSSKRIRPLRTGLNYPHINPEWAWVYSESETGIPASSIETNDGGYLVSGIKYLPLALSLLKLSPFGYIEWAYEYPPQSHGHSVQQTDDNGYVIVSHSGSVQTVPRTDFLVLKLFQNGAVDWARVYGGDSFDRAFSIQQTKDGGFIVVGCADERSFIPNSDIYNMDVWVLKLFSNGDVEWQRTYGGPEHEISDGSSNKSTILQTQDGGYLFATESKSFSESTWGNSWPDLWLVKLSPAGDIVWQKAYGGKESELFFHGGPCIQETSDGKIYVAATTYSFGANYSDVWVLKLLSNGNIEWQKRYDSGQAEQGVSLRLAENGGCVVFGSTAQSAGSAITDYLLLKLSPSGDIETQKKYDGATGSTDRCKSGYLTSDGGFLLAGYRVADDDNEEDVFVIKTSPTGAVGPNCGLVSTPSLTATDTPAVPLDTNTVSRTPDNWHSYEIAVDFLDAYFTPKLLCWNLNQPPIDVNFQQSADRSYTWADPVHTISWQPNPLNDEFTIDEYLIYRKDVHKPNAEFKKIGSVASNIYFYEDDSGLTQTGDYLYYVTSVDEFGNESPPSITVGNTTQ
jgi:hypothetical protein